MSDIKSLAIKNTIRIIIDMSGICRLTMSITDITANTEYVLTKGSAEGLVMLIILEPTE